MLLAQYKGTSKEQYIHTNYLHFLVDLNFHFNQMAIMTNSLREVTMNQNNLGETHSLLATWGEPLICCKTASVNTT